MASWSQSATNTFTKRVVTALPDAYLTKVPTELIHLAKFRLLEDETGVISDILARQHCQLLYRQSESVAHYIVRYPGFCLKAGYDSHANRLVPYLKQNSLTYPHKMSARERFRIFELDPNVAEQVRRKIRSGESTFLRRYSNAVTFHRVEIGTQTLQVGYSKLNGTLYNYADPVSTGGELERTGTA